MDTWCQMSSMQRHSDRAYSDRLNFSFDFWCLDLIQGCLLTNCMSPVDHCFPALSPNCHLSTPWEISYQTPNRALSRPPLVMTKPVDWIMVDLWSVAVCLCPGLVRWPSCGPAVNYCSFMSKRFPVFHFLAHMHFNILPLKSINFKLSFLWGWQKEVSECFVGPQ